jgi:hypothetical protein
LKNTIILVFIFCSSLCFSQFLNISTLDHDTCLDKKFSIVFHIVLDSNYTVGLTTPAVLGKMIDTLNSTFKPICVSFVNCSTTFIPNYPFNKWKKAITDPVVTSNWYVDKTINIYIVDSIKDLMSIPEFGAGYAYKPPFFPGDSIKDVIVLEDQEVFFQWQGIFHHFGHYFGLDHTHDEVGTGAPASPGPPTGVSSQEYGNGSNCATHGDCLCDTEADPGDGSKYDGNGNRYLPPIDNFMAPYPPNGCRYSNQQYLKMARCIVAKRLYLH